MKFILPSAKLLKISGTIQDIETYGRVCYKSEEKIGPETAPTFIRNLIKRGHEAVLEHVSATIRIVCDRGVSHEIVRHRLASYCQESTRYVNYKDKPMEFVLPHWLLRYEGGMLSTLVDVRSIDFLTRYGALSAEYKWFSLLDHAEQTYNFLIKAEWAPQDARAILPNALKTEIVMTANLREWRHFFKMRLPKSAHPDMRIIAKQCYNEFLTDETGMSVVFEDFAPIVTGDIK